jgi:hypothetical protein
MSDFMVKAWYNEKTQVYEFFTEDGTPVPVTQKVVVNIDPDGFHTADVKLLVEIVNSKPTHDGGQ